MNAYVKGLRAEAASLRKQSETLAATLVTENRPMTVTEATEDDARYARGEVLANELKRYDRLENIQTEQKTAHAPGPRPYANLGDQLVDVMRAEMRGQAVPEKLRQFDVNAAVATGLNEGTAAEGGYFVQSDIAAGIKEKLYDIGSFLNRVNRITIGPNANGLKIPAVDESSRADGSRYGGLRAYWVDEAQTITGSKPKFRMLELSLKKLAGLCYATDELLADAGALGQFLVQRMPQEMLYTLENSLFNGTGVGQPLGFLNSGAVKTVGLISDQTLANAITIENITEMYAAMWPRSRGNAAWYISTTVEPHLMRLKIGDTPVWMQPGNGATASPYATLMGRPVIPVEYLPTLGTLGDICFVDPTQYTYIEKGGINQAQSMHVRFLQEEMAFRFTMRCDGLPEWNSVLTARDGVTTYSPFVTLAARS